MAPSVASDDDTRSIAQLYAELTAYLDDRWGRGQQVWVYGEVQKPPTIAPGTAISTSSIPPSWDATRRR